MPDLQVITDNMIESLDDILKIVADEDIDDNLEVRLIYLIGDAARKLQSMGAELGIKLTYELEFDLP